MDRRPERVRAVYDRIATHFAQTREHPWPDVATFVEEADPVATALDLGCGNGRHAELLAARADRTIGVDLSRGVLEEARDRAADHGFALDLVQGDAASLPLRHDRVGLAVYIAAVHHLPDRTTRVASFDELARVLTSGGRGLVSAWSTAHDRFDADGEAGFDTTVDWTLPCGETVDRFYHIYAPAEFERDLAASNLGVARTWVSGGNCYAVVTG